jgi:chitin-binding protein
MCWNAYNVGDPSALWNWNGMLRDGLGSNYKAQVPDGTLCSAGGNASSSGRYNYLDTPGNWIATNKSTSFKLNLVDQASHNADWIDVYISGNGYDPTTERLAWGDLNLVGHTGSDTGTGIVDPEVGGKAYSVNVNASGFTGRRVLFTVWKASHADQIYFLCSDVNIGGSGGQQTTTTTTRGGGTTTTTTTRGGGTTTTTTTTRGGVTTSTTTRGGTGGTCSVALDTSNSWGSGFVAQAKVTANQAITGWKVTVNLPSGVATTGSWSATQSGTSGTVTFSNASYNGGLGAGASTTFGFQGTGNPNGMTATCS